VDYWIWGGGQWVNRWHASGSDTLACVVSISCASVMVLTYLTYAFQTNRSLKYVENQTFRKHLIELRNVVLMCSVIHFLTMVLYWFVPYFYVTSLLVVIHITQVCVLISRKQNVLAIQEHTQGKAAEEQIEEIWVVIQKAQSSELKNRFSTLCNSLEEIFERNPASSSEIERQGSEAASE